MRAKLEELINQIKVDEFIDGVISDRREKSNEVIKIKIRKVLIKNDVVMQTTEYIGKQVMHSNKTYDEFKKYFVDKMEKEYKQCVIEAVNSTINILVSKKGQVTIKKKQKISGDEKMKAIPMMHNREKNYILKEGTNIDFLIELGVMNKDGYVLKPRYDKFRQINRFLEFVDDIVQKLPNDRPINIIDFGCGKSYLTFAIYYYLRKLKNLEVNIVGLDLKKDVIAKCNDLVNKLGYDGLKFLMGDIADYEGQDNVDMVVTLHACDTATDYALYKAVKWNAKVILSVPCCQHEINGQIENEMLEPVLKYGILKEKISALITDGIRGETLREYGYDTQILEFIDMEHTPKNLLVRAVKKNNASYIENKELTNMIESLGLKPTIKELLK